MAFTARAAVVANFVATKARDSQNRLITSGICGMWVQVSDVGVSDQRTGNVR